MQNKRAVSKDDNSGIVAKFKPKSVWMWASMPPKDGQGVSPKQDLSQTISTKEKGDTDPLPPAAPSPQASGDETAPDPDVKKLLIENPRISAVTFFNLLKAKGFKIVNAIPDLKSQAVAIDKAQKEECGLETNDSSGATALLRSTTKEAGLKFTSRLLESAARDNGVGPYKFKVVLLTEGLGNKVDGYYYTRESLDSAVPIFEGKKIYANHPDAISEKVLPERDVKDILGHFENIAVEQSQESDDGRAVLTGDVVILPDEPYRWARALMRHSVEFAKKYPDKEFVGLSINANGYNTPMRISEFLESAPLPNGAKPKLQEALQDGLDIIKVVSRFKDAVSCDLVTEAGAGGKVLEMLEKEKSMGKKKEADGDAGHADAAQDKELIQKMIKKHMGDDASDEEAAKAMEAYEFHKKEGMSHEDAMKHAASSMKCAKHLSEKSKEDAADGKDGKDSHDAPKDVKKPEDKQDGADMDESEAEEAQDVKESIKILSRKVKELQTDNIKLKGAVAGYEAEKTQRDVEDYLDEKLGKSGLPRAVTKTFRESVKTAKNKQEVDRLLGVFLEGYKHRGVAAAAFGKVPAKGETKAKGETEGGEGFSDCI